MLSFDRFQPPKGNESVAKMIAKCFCGCGREIFEGYEHVDYDGDWFYDEDCLFKYLGVVRRAAG